MKKVLNENQATRQERCEHASDEIYAVLSKMPQVYSAGGLSDDVMNEVLLDVADWMVERPTSAKLIKILRQRNRSHPLSSGGGLGGDAGQG